MWIKHIFLQTTFWPHHFSVHRLRILLQHLVQEAAWGMVFYWSHVDLDGQIMET